MPPQSVKGLRRLSFLLRHILPFLKDMPQNHTISYFPRKGLPSCGFFSALFYLQAFFSGTAVRLLLKSGRTMQPHFRFEEEFMSDKDFYLRIDGRRVKVSEEVYLEYRRSVRCALSFVKIYPKFGKHRRLCWLNLG